MHNINKIF